MKILPRQTNSNTKIFPGTEFLVTQVFWISSSSHNIQEIKRERPNTEIRHKCIQKIWEDLAYFFFYPRYYVFLFVISKREVRNLYICLLYNENNLQKKKQATRDALKKFPRKPDFLLFNFGHKYISSKNLVSLIFFFCDFVKKNSHTRLTGFSFWKFEMSRLISEKMTFNDLENDLWRNETFFFSFSFTKPYGAEIIKKK